MWFGSLELGKLPLFVTVALQFMALDHRANNHAEMKHNYSQKEITILPTTPNSTHRAKIISSARTLLAA